MEQRHHQHHTNSPSNNSFILGILVGVIVTLLLVTKKGRKILRMLTDESIEKFEDLETFLEQKIATEKPLPNEPVTEDTPDALQDAIEYVPNRPVPPVVAEPPVAYPAIDHQIHHGTNGVHHHATSLQSLPARHTSDYEEAHVPALVTTQSEGEHTAHHMHPVRIPPAPTIHSPHSSRRRFFKGIPKRN